MVSPGMIRRGTQFLGCRFVRGGMSSGSERALAYASSSILFQRGSGWALKSCAGASAALFLMLSLPLSPVLSMALCMVLFMNATFPAVAGRLLVLSGWPEATSALFCAGRPGQAFLAALLPGGFKPALKMHLCLCQPAGKTMPRRSS
ncbi:MAG: hypothetical protein K6C33_02870 [Desulfovibrio sp.]|nr:hypothetical protein [Desulfovibrio sp.]